MCNLFHPNHNIQHELHYSSVAAEKYPAIFAAPAPGKKKIGAAGEEVLRVCQRCDRSVRHSLGLPTRPALGRGAPAALHHHRAGEGMSNNLLLTWLCSFVYGFFRAS